MTTTIHDNQSTNMVVHELNGEVVAAEEQVIIRATGTTKSVIAAALARSGTPPAPVPGEAFSDDYTDLRVEERRCEVISTSGTEVTVRVHVVYRLQHTIGTGYIRGGASIAQVRTSTSAGRVIKVQYDPATGTPTGPNADVQVAEVDVFTPRAAIEIVRVVQTTDPVSYQLGLVGKVNADSWGGGFPREWIVADAQYERVDAAPDDNNRYRFIFRLEYQENGFDSLVAYEDPATGRRPDFDEDDIATDLITPAIARFVENQREIVFSAEFGLPGI